MPGEHSHPHPQPKKAGWFATTSWTELLLARQAESPQAKTALENLCRTYWYPLYSYVRRQDYNAEDAEDLTQAYFQRILESNYLGALDRRKGKFRSFLLAGLNHFLSEKRAWDRAAKRGGGQALVALDHLDAEARFRSEPASELSPDKIYEQRWAITVLEQARGRLRQEYEAAGKRPLLDALREFIEERAAMRDYSEVAPRLKMTPNAVAVAVHRLRQRYGDLVRAEVARTVASPADVEGELRHLFAVLSG